MKTEVLPYQRVGYFEKGFEKLKTANFLGSILTKSNIILIPAAFLLGRASLFGGLMPFGVALYAATIGMDLNRLLIAAAVLLGMVTTGAEEQIYLAAVGMLLFNAFNLPFKKSKPHKAYKFAITGFIAVGIPQMVMVYLQGFLLYDVLKALLYGFIVFLLIFIYRKAIPVLTEKGHAAVFTHEETISVAVSAALALSGLAGLKVLGFDIKNVLCILIILIFAYKSGPGVGSAIGVSTGLIVSMSSTVTPLVISSFAFCGLLAGLFKELGKVGACLGFIMGNAVLTLYLNNSSEVLIHLKEVVIGAGLFALIPAGVIDKAAAAFIRHGDASDKRSYSLRLKELTVEKLNKFSHAFKELSRTFSEISQTSTVTDKQDISTLFDRVADRVCKDCSLCLHCWDRNFYNTYQVMFKIVEKLESKGRIEDRDIPGYFMERCERLGDFVDAVNNVYEIFKVDTVWKNKLGESRDLVSQQLDGLSRVISNLAAEIDVDVHFKAELEDAILAGLAAAGIKAGDAVVYENKWGKYEISIFHKGCGGKRLCTTSIEKVVSGIVARKMVRETSECCQRTRHGGCSLRLVEEEVFSVTTGVAKLPKKEGGVSGDSYTFMSNGDGKYVLALSDGMGSGQKASTQSRATISLLEQFMDSGFDKDTAVKLINSILVMKSNEDSFATIDLSVIDLFNGEVEFVKIGSVPTFIKRHGKVETVRMASLPAGILGNIETELVHRKVDSGDVLIMLSDGITDCFRSEDGGDGELVDFIQGLDTANPQQIADDILGEAYDRAGGKPLDDMSVLAAKVWKRPGV